MSEVKHGRANHDLISENPECLCGAKGVKDSMWDRFYCPTDGIWLKGIYAQCWCQNCLSKSHISDEDECVNNPQNSW